MPSFFGARPVRGGGAARSGDHDAPATAPVRLAWTQGRCHREGGSHRSCLGVLVGVPDRSSRSIRSDGSSPDRHPSRDRGPRAQAVSGCPVDLQLW